MDIKINKLDIYFLVTLLNKDGISFQNIGQWLREHGMGDMTIKWDGNLKRNSNYKYSYSSNVIRFEYDNSLGLYYPNIEHYMLNKSELQQIVKNITVFKTLPGLVDTLDVNIKHLILTYTYNMSKDKTYDDIYEYFTDRFSRMSYDGNNTTKGINKGYTVTKFKIQNNNFLDVAKNITNFCKIMSKLDSPIKNKSDASCLYMITNLGVKRDSFWKNIAPELDNMGIVKRDRDGWTLTEIGLKISLCEDIFELASLINNAVKDMFDKDSEYPTVLTDLCDILTENQSLDPIEMFLFLDKNVKSLPERSKLIGLYRKEIKSPSKKRMFDEKFKNIIKQCESDNWIKIDPTKSGNKLPKLARIDMYNQYNAISQIFGRLNNINLFFYDKDDSKRLKFKAGFGESRSIKYRSGADIREAKEKHDSLCRIRESLLDGNEITIEGHHCVNHDYIRTINGKDRELIEHWLNVIPLTAEQHSMIPNRKMEHIKFDYDNEYIYFINFYDSTDILKFERSTWIGKADHLEKMKDHNALVIQYLKSKSQI